MGGNVDDFSINDEADDHHDDNHDEKNYIWM